MSNENRTRVKKTAIGSMFMIIGAVLGSPIVLFALNEIYENRIELPNKHRDEASQRRDQAITELATLIHKNIETDVKERAEIKQSIALHVLKDEVTTKHFISKLEECEDEIKQCKNKHIYFQGRAK